jgi:hypothetical protein
MSIQILQAGGIVFQIELISASFVRNSVKYDCCPENYPNLTFNVVFKQKAIFTKDSEMRHP